MFKHLSISLFTILSFFSVELSAGELTVYAMKSPVGLSWKSPAHLTWSVLNNSFVDTPHSLNHPIGHINIRVSCPEVNDSDNEFLTGMTTFDDTEERWLLLDKKAGMGTMFHNFRGRLQTDQEIEEDLETRFENGDVTWIKYFISKKTCKRVIQYFKEYRDNGYGENYGLPNRPRYGEGAGCTAFGSSFLEIAGVMSEEYVKNWKFHFIVPKEITGYPMNEKEVRVSKVLFDPISYKWKQNPKEGYFISFWDAELMFDWIKNKMNQVINNPNSEYRMDFNKAASGLKINKRQTPTPTDAIWKQ